MMNIMLAVCGFIAMDRTAIIGAAQKIAAWRSCTC